MQLSGPEIVRLMNIPNPNNPQSKPDIIIEPFIPACLGSNSYDLHLDNILRIYKKTLPRGMKPAIPYVKGVNFKMRDWFETPDAYMHYLRHPQDFDPRNPEFMLNPFDQDKELIEIIIPENGVILSPNIGYLGSTVEYTETYNLFPYIDGKSSGGRHFIQNHYTAGRGDDGFIGTWTLEIGTMYPTLVKPGMRIGQKYYEHFTGSRQPYNENPNSHYVGQRGPTAGAKMKIDPEIIQFMRDRDSKQK